jgi:hypothetical protein
MALKLVENADKAHSWASMWWSGIGFVSSTADLIYSVWTGIDKPVLDRIPHAPAVGVVLFAAVMISRVLVWTHDQLREGTDNASQ